MRTNHSHVHVALVGSHAELPDIAPLLPRRWSSVRYHDLSRLGEADVVVLGGVSPARVAAARLLHPTATILAVTAQRVSDYMIMSMMCSGADACVHAGTSVWLARHVLGAHHLRHRLSTIGGAMGGYVPPLQAA